MRSAKAKKAFLSNCLFGAELALLVRHAGDRREVTPHTWIKKRHDMVEESRPCPYLALRSWCGSACPSRPARGCAFSVLSLLNPLHPAEHIVEPIDTAPEQRAV